MIMRFEFVCTFQKLEWIPQMSWVSVWKPANHFDGMHQNTNNYFLLSVLRALDKFINPLAIFKNRRKKSLRKIGSPGLIEYLQKLTKSLDGNM